MQKLMEAYFKETNKKLIDIYHNKELCSKPSDFRGYWSFSTQEWQDEFIKDFLDEYKEKFQTNIVNKNNRNYVEEYIVNFKLKKEYPNYVFTENDIDKMVDFKKSLILKEMDCNNPEFVASFKKLIVDSKRGLKLRNGTHFLSNVLMDEESYYLFDDKVIEYAVNEIIKKDIK